MCIYKIQKNDLISDEKMIFLKKERLAVERKTINIWQVPVVKVKTINNFRFKVTLKS